MPWTFADIKRKTRQVTGRYSPTELSEVRLGEYVNNYYQFTFPAEVKLEREHTFYEFNTVANQQQYTLPNSTFTNFEPTIWVDEQPILWYQEPNEFFQQNPQCLLRSTPWTGNGATLNYSTTIQQPPILPGSVIVTDNTETFTDDGNGLLVGDMGGVGNVNYTTGFVDVTFNAFPANGQNIYLTVIIFVANRPTAVMLYNNVFWFYPIPDTVYRCRVKAYRIDSPMVNATDTPRLEEWGEAIAYGAARDIHADYGEMDRYQEVTALYKEQIGYVLTRTCQNLLNTRSRPMF